MKPRRLLLAIGLAGVCLLLSSCIDTKNPLSDPEKAKADPQLAGVWRRTDAMGDMQYRHVGQAGGQLPPGIMRIVFADHDKDGHLGRPHVMLAFPTTIAENHYLNILTINDENLEQLQNNGWQAGLADGYCLLKYRVEGDSLLLWQIDQDVKRRFIEAGKIKGTIDKKSVFFTDTTAKLNSLLASPEGAGLFKKEPVRYQRVK